MQAAGAAIRENGEVFRVLAALDRDLADDVGHLRVDDLDHRRRRVLHRHAERIGDPRLDRLARLLRVEPHAAAEEEVRVEAAEHEVRVGDGRLAAALFVAGRTRPRARALRADAQHAGFRLDPADAAAAGADRRHVDHRQGERIFVDDRAVGIAGLAVDQDADVEAGAANVRGENLVDAELLAERLRAERAAGGTGHQQRRAAAARLLDRTQAAGGVHHRHRAFQPGVDQLLPHHVEIARHRRREIGVHHRGRGALVFADQRRQFMRRRDDHAGDFPLDPFLDGLLVRRVEERPEEADRDRLDALVLELLQDRLGAFEIERHDDAAATIDTLVDAMNARTRHQRNGLAQPRHVDDFGFGQARDLLRGAADQHHVLVALGRDERGLGPGTGDQHVGRDRGAVREQDGFAEHVLERTADALRHLRDGIKHALIEIRRRRWRLGARHRSIAIECDAVCEGATAVDRDNVAHRRPFLPCRISLLSVAAHACFASQSADTQESSSTGSSGRAISTSSRVMQDGQ